MDVASALRKSDDEALAMADFIIESQVAKLSPPSRSPNAKFGIRLLRQGERCCRFNGRFSVQPTRRRTYRETFPHVPSSRIRRRYIQRHHAENSDHAGRKITLGKSRELHRIARLCRRQQLVDLP